MAKKDMDDVISGIRACLISVKGKCDLKQLNNDFIMLMGHKIPYAQFGYKSLEDFVLNAPSLSTTRVGSQLFVDAKLTSTTSHMASLVNKQKDPPSRRKRPPPKRMTHRNFNNAAARWKPKNANKNKSYQSSPRPAAVSHNQFVKVPASSKTNSTSNVGPRLSNRLNAIKELKSAEPKIQTKKDDVELEKENDSNSLTKKAKQRLIEKMAGINLNANDYNPNESNGTIWDINAELCNTPIVSPISSNSSDGYFEQTQRNPHVKDDFVVQLQNFAKLHQLGEPTFSIKSIKQGRNTHVVHYVGLVKVGCDSFTSYPEEKTDEASAKQVVAKLALKQLTEKYNNLATMLISDNRDVLQRLPKLVELHPQSTGVWTEQLEAYYIKKYKERLPVNWVEIADTLPCIAVSTVFGGSVLRFCKPDEIFQKGNNFGTPLVPYSISVPSNTVKFNNYGELFAEVTCAVSAGEIWCRQVDIPELDQFMEMMSSLEDYYNRYGEEERVENVEIGGYYVACFENMWGRVRVFEINESSYNCFCIDFGDEWILQKSNLYSLNLKFAYVAAQAFVCRLSGLEELYEASKSLECLHNLLGKIVKVQLDANNEDSGRSTADDPALPVIFVEPENENVVINKEMISLITLESAMPVLSKNSPTEVYVTCALDDGSIYVQVHSIGYEQLCQMLQELEKDLIEDKISLPNVPITPGNSKDRLYLVCDNDGHWHRAKIIDWAPNNKHVQILYVDCGKTSIVKLSDEVLHPLNEFSDVLNMFPYQAVRVRMMLNNIPSNFVDKITSLMPSNQPVLLKQVKDDTEEPMVEFFKRSEVDNVLFSVNTALSVETEFKNANDGNNNMGKSQSIKLQRLISLNQFETTIKNVPSSGSLSCPPLPQVGRYFDVKIPFAVNPYNFFIQPYESNEKLTKLMSILQETYKDVQHSPIRIEDVQPGKIYASKHEDGIWYRTSVLKVIHHGSISVFYCDFGYYANLHFKQLLPLDKQFMELPHQAIKAKLAGIEPKNSKWSMDDCKFFEKLVCKKSFVSILITQETDDLYRYDTLLSLKLIDTSTDVDIHIDKVLVEEGIAKFVGTGMH